MTDRESLTAGVSGPHGGQPVVTAGAPRGATEAVLLVLHGRGATAQGVVNLFEPTHRHGVTVVAPEAERSRWYPHAADDPIERNEPHVSSALGVVDALVEDATATLGVPRDRIVLAGFSQGASVAAEYAARNPERYGGVAVLRGALLGSSVDQTRYDGDLSGTPVLVASGAEDSYVPAGRAGATAAVFRALDGVVTERRYEGVGHEVTDDDFAFVAQLLDDIVSSS